jgi:hypothetical protein
MPARGFAETRKNSLRKKMKKYLCKKSTPQGQAGARIFHGRLPHVQGVT